jgi:multiple sugar transport system substrate-binding protein
MRLLLLALTILAAGCAFRDSGDIRVTAWGSARAKAFYERICHDFGTKYHCVVSLEFIPYGSYFQKVQVELAGGRPPDVMLIDAESFPRFADGGLFAQLGPARTGDIAWEALAWKGRQYGVPKGMSFPLGIAYNKRLFREAKVPYPKDTWTWDDFRRIAHKLTDPTKHIYGFGGWTLERLYMATRGDFWLNKTATACRFGSSLGREALKFQAALLFTDRSQPLPQEAAAMSPGNDQGMFFTTGRLAMAPCAAWQLPEFKAAIKNFDWDIAPVPNGGTKIRSLVNVEGFCIPNGARHKDIARKFLEFVVSHPAQMLLAQSQDNLPVDKRARESPEYKAGLPPGVKHIINALNEGVTLGHRGPRTRQGLAVYAQKAALLWNGKLSVDQFLATSIPEIDRALKEDDF